MMKSVIKIIIFLVVTDTVYSQVNTEYFETLQTERITSSEKLVWKQFGPGMAGYCEEFWCHPTDKNVMFQSPDMYNSYGSWDNGQSWQTIKDVDGSGKDMRRIKSIEFSRQNPDFGFAIDVRGELYKTLDKGRTWAFVRDMGGQHSQLSVDPTDDSVWYMGSGSFWNVKANHRKQSDLRGYVYTYADYGHVFKSTDGGQTWQKKKTGLPNTLDVGRIVVDPINSNNILLASNSGVYRSTDKGESWRLSGTGLPNNLPRDMTSYYNSATGEFVLYVLEQTFYEKSGNTVSAKGGVYKSIDGGLNWTSITGDLAVDLTQINNSITRTKYWRAIAYWFDISVDEAKSQYPEYPSEVLSVFNRIVVNPKDKKDIYIAHNVKHDYAFGPGDVWKTNDGGSHWFATARSGTYWEQDKNSSYWSLRNNPKGVNTEFAHLKYEKDTQEEFYGNRFLQINKEGEVFICLDQQVMRSNDKGQNWSQVDDFETEPNSDAWVGRGASNLPGRFMLLETGVKNRKLFCSGEHGLWELADLGSYPDKDAVAVRQIEGQVHHKGATSIASVAVNPKNPDEIYTLQFRQDHRGYFRRSTDGGKTWSNLSYPVPYGGNLSADNIFQYSLTVDYEDPNNIYFCVMPNAVTEVSNTKIPNDFTGFGVYRSVDGGNTWSIENTGLPNNSSVNRLKMDPENPSTLYAALNEGSDGSLGGLFKTTNKGGNWSRISIPSSIKAVNNVFVDRNNKYLYISCGRDEGNYSEGGVWRSKDDGANWEKIFDMPYVWQTETSPVNPDIITVNVPLQHETKGKTTFNPGAYISFDGGVSWEKVNKNLGQPDTITDFKPDPEDERVFWIALKGSGWAKGVYMTDEKTISVKTIDSSCPGESNGEIQIKSLYNGAFTVFVNGEGVDKTLDFTKEITVEGLSKGSYVVKVTSKDSPVEEDYIVIVSEPSRLSVAEKVVVNNTVKYQLEENEVYKVYHNNKMVTVSDNVIELKLDKGQNQIEIKTDKDCKGTFSDVVFNAELLLYPNPATNNVTIQLNEAIGSGFVRVYSMQGNLVLSKNTSSSEIDLNTSSLFSGVYQVDIQTMGRVLKSKLIIK